MIKLDITFELFNHFSEQFVSEERVFAKYQVYDPTTTIIYFETDFYKG